MSLDIDVHNTRTDERMEMSWLRNPYGLCTWAEANYLYTTKSIPFPDEKSLWYVINHWCYDTSEQVDKPLFLEVVKRYAEVILKLEKGYFWFDVSSFMSFVLPHMDVLPTEDFFKQTRIKDNVFHDRQIGIPMDYFSNPCFHLSDKYRPDAHTLTHYQDWYRDLIKFAEMLQDPDAVYYCSN